MDVIPHHTRPAWLGHLWASQHCSVITCLLTLSRLDARSPPLLPPVAAVGAPFAVGMLLARMIHHFTNKVNVHVLYRCVVSGSGGRDPSPGRIYETFNTRSAGQRKQRVLRRSRQERGGQHPWQEVRPAIKGATRIPSGEGRNHRVKDYCFKMLPVA